MSQFDIFIQFLNHNFNYTFSLWLFKFYKLWYGKIFLSSDGWILSFK